MTDEQLRQEALAIMDELANRKRQKVRHRAARGMVLARKEAAKVGRCTVAHLPVGLVLDSRRKVTVATEYQVAVAADLYRRLSRGVD